MKIISNLIEAHIFRELNGFMEFLLLKRSSDQYYPDVWQMVSGKIKENEKAFESALREIKEETSIKPEKFWVAPTVNSFYSPDEDYICILPVFVAKVRFDTKVILSKEHSEFKWASVDEAKELLAWEGQRRSVDVIVDYFVNRNSFLNFIEIKM